ncbi:MULTISPECIES: LytTR family DNA-binding domain-containing protein [unclassified Spirosoma]|uniref:LytR/AlgR family response regulator transcription factor n=1 Tax=unclassified Spirosoma TaxID=2621999 RepID=UPI000961CB0A|nr:MULTISPECIES: LytTR family DNA-binding domain-containing protein [unclassified Spirosoma]MBN8827015.1 response regulator transcription factor [Spirosoma sp.]OJW74438.1 MAG: hypothetical protein BGO59_19640 [Spirosoma sp. 48-14]
MTNLNVLIIEDDPVWQFSLQAMFGQLDVASVRLASSIAEANQKLHEQLPDLVIADIVLPDGLSLGLFTQNYKQLPVIFQTAYTKDDYLRRAITMPNIGFLVKPFEVFGLKAAIEILFAQKPITLFPAANSITTTDKRRQRIDIPLDEIYWIKGEGNYSIIHTVDQKYVLKRSLRKLALELTDRFIQVQKAYIINIHYIERILESTVQINQQPIPIGRAYKKNLLNLVDPRKRMFLRS